MMDNNDVTVNLTVNGELHSITVEPRVTLADVLRDHLRLTGTHLGCEHGVCGACTVLIDDEPARSCLAFAVQVDGSSIVTVEGVTPGDGTLSSLQQSFMEAHGLQCGFCTPGFIVTAHAFLELNHTPTREEIRAAVSGNLCRCTGYQGIVDAVERAARKTAPQDVPPPTSE